jgi:uncharacterized membrane protein
VGFVLKSNTFTDIPGPKGATFTQAYGINDADTIVGVFVDAKYLSHGFLLKSGKYSTYTTINVPGATNSEAWDIDNNGDVVYQWSDAKGTHGALRLQGKYYKFDDPLGVGSTGATGINDHSQTVGGYDAGGFHGFEATY